MNFKSILLAFLALASLAFGEPLFRIHDGKEWKDIDAEAWGKLPRADITAKARDGKDRKFSGVPFAEILKLLNAPTGAALRGPEMNRVILITAKDNYQVAFSLAELDAGFRSQNIIIADQVDGEPLSEFEGQRMVVCGDDLKHSRWIRQITGILLTRPETP